jgi:diketogulonate reductase-like aldo/keto reductase
MNLACLLLSLILSHQLHPFCQQRPIVEYCKALGIVVQAYCPVIRGQLDDPLFIELAAKVRYPTPVIANYT